MKLPSYYFKKNAFFHSIFSMNLHHPFTSIYVHSLLNSTLIYLAPCKTGLYQEIHLYNGVERICIHVKFNIFKVKEDDNNHIKHYFNNGKIIHPPGSTKYIIYLHASLRILCSNQHSSILLPTKCSTMRFIFVRGQNDFTLMCPNFNIFNVKEDDNKL